MTLQITMHSVDSFMVQCNRYQLSLMILMYLTRLTEGYTYNSSILNGMIQINKLTCGQLRRHPAVVRCLCCAVNVAHLCTVTYGRVTQLARWTFGKLQRGRAGWPGGAYWVGAAAASAAAVPVTSGDWAARWRRARAQACCRRPARASRVATAAPPPPCPAPLAPPRRLSKCRGSMACATGASL